MTAVKTPEKKTVKNEQESSIRRFFTALKATLDPGSISRNVVSTQKKTQAKSTVKVGPKTGTTTVEQTQSKKTEVA